MSGSTDDPQAALDRRIQEIVDRRIRTLISSGQLAGGDRTRELGAELREKADDLAGRVKDVVTVANRADRVSRENKAAADAAKLTAPAAPKT